MDAPLFHLAIPINDITIAKEYYSQGLGCSVGRENSQAVIFDFYGHQVVAHMTKEPLVPQKGIYPRHFGLVFPQEEAWERLFNRAKEKQLKFYQDSKLRFHGQLIEHRTFFLADPFYNLMEFKFYRHREAIFAGQTLTAIGDTKSV